MIDFLLWLWQFPQNVIGFVISIKHHNSCMWMVNGDWVKVYFKKNFFRGGVSLGNYVILDSIYESYRNGENTVKHEHGHQIQSKYLGLFYLVIIGLPSMIGNIYSRVFNKSSEWYYRQPWELWADRLGKVERWNLKK